MYQRPVRGAPLTTQNIVGGAGKFLGANLYVARQALRQLRLAVREAFLMQYYPVCTANVEKAGQLHRGCPAPLMGHWRTGPLKSCSDLFAYVIRNKRWAAAQAASSQLQPNGKTRAYPGLEHFTRSIFDPIFSLNKMRNDKNNGAEAAEESVNSQVTIPPPSLASEQGTAALPAGKNGAADKYFNPLLLDI